MMTSRRAALVAGGGLALTYGFNPSPFNDAFTAATRSTRTVTCAARIVADYSYNFYIRKDPSRKSEVHQQSANRLLNLCLKNGGIYIKLGQHLSSLVYLLPQEYTSTLRVLQDSCYASSLDDISNLFQQDKNTTLDTEFSFFDPIPLGVASLAQVHKAKLKNSDDFVAVKIQHPYLDHSAPIDIKVCSRIVKTVKAILPGFEFDWLAIELENSLPKELNFVMEAENADRCRAMFSSDPVLKVPSVVWATRRILVMEYIEGGKVNDLGYLTKNKIDKYKISAHLARMYAKMIFQEGFVHCDPHPGNVFVRPIAPASVWKTLASYFIPSINPNNFEIVLLDHGLYREISKELRLDYAHLWISIINKDEANLEYYSHRLFSGAKSKLPSQTADGTIDYHRLFASMLTGRQWSVLFDKEEEVTAKPTMKELDQIQTQVASSKFFMAIVKILASLPREVLLLLKTGDLLRAVDADLDVCDSIEHHLAKTVGIQGWYCSRAIWRDTPFKPWTLQYWACFIEYLKTGCRLTLMNAYISLHY